MVVGGSRCPACLQVAVLKAADGPEERGSSGRLRNRKWMLESPDTFCYFSLSFSFQEEQSSCDFSTPPSIHHTHTLLLSLRPLPLILVSLYHSYRTFITLGRGGHFTSTRGPAARLLKVLLPLQSRQAGSLLLGGGVGPETLRV